MFCNLSELRKKSGKISLFSYHKIYENITETYFTLHGKHTENRKKNTIIKKLNYLHMKSRQLYSHPILVSLSLIFLIFLLK